MTMTLEDGQQLEGDHPAPNYDEGDDNYDVEDGVSWPDNDKNPPIEQEGAGLSQTET